MATRQITICDRCGKVVDKPVVYERVVSRARLVAEDDNENVYTHHACVDCATYYMRTLASADRSRFNASLTDARMLSHVEAQRSQKARVDALEGMEP